MAATVAKRTRKSISVYATISNENTHQPESSLRVRLYYKFGRCQGCAIVGGGECGAVVNTLNYVRLHV
jgi:hypothetical protein